jgi:hypothetical protein
MSFNENAETKSGAGGTFENVRALLPPITFRFMRLPRDLLRMRMSARSTTAFITRIINSNPKPIFFLPLMLEEKRNGAELLG